MLLGWAGDGPADDRVASAFAHLLTLCIDQRQYKRKYYTRSTKKKKGTITWKCPVPQPSCFCRLPGTFVAFPGRLWPFRLTPSLRHRSLPFSEIEY